MKIVAGLGNPGAQYANTPHSIGFEVVEALARAQDASWREQAAFKGACATLQWPEVGKVMLVKPLTFMNLSGACIQPLAHYHHVDVSDVIVVSDDIDLPVGRLRIRVGGSAGGHNGLKNIIERLGSPQFVRVRVGVGRAEAGRSRVIGHVLGKFDAETRTAMDAVVPAAVRAVGQILAQGPQAAMNAWNGAEIAPA